MMKSVIHTDYLVSEGWIMTKTNLAISAIIFALVAIGHIATFKNVQR
jgi:hypothetical protein